MVVLGKRLNSKAVKSETSVALNQNESRLI